MRDDAASESLQQALARSLDYLSKQPAGRSLNAVDRKVAVADLNTMLTAAQGMASGDMAGMCDRFKLYRVDAGKPLLVTGYYQPQLSASRKRSDRFRYPLYRIPSDIVDIDLGDFCPSCAGKITQGRVQDGKLVPYYTRADIDGGVLNGRDLELAWLDDPIEAFFLQVQGSGVLRFEDGVTMQASYSSSNGRPYTSLGKVLVDQGKMSRDAVSLSSLKEYLRAHPSEQASLMASNQRYIFFRAVITGPIGSLTEPLTSGRSIAADPTVYPQGGLAFLHIDPRPGVAPVDRNINRLVLVQDAGTAISGAERLDVYWGSGSTAEDIAGMMRNAGEVYLFLPE